jgi:hypothetical protein
MKIDMDLAVVLNIHNDSDVVFDTIDSVLAWMTDKVLVIVDGVSWNKVKNTKFQVYKLEGFYHACQRAPYRNITLGLKEAFNLWPNSHWYCYMEYDCLVASDAFKAYLEAADRQKIWCLGNDHRVSNIQFPLLEKIIKNPIVESHYLLGACVFHHHDFLESLMEVDFFSRFLSYTNDFSQGFFPEYEEYDFGEHLFPTLAHQFGGDVRELAKWAQDIKSGYWKHFPIRFRPEFNKITDVKDASIIHPVKNYDNPIRVLCREQRQGKL